MGPLVEEEEEFLQVLAKTHPNLKDKKLFNDEADPEKSWWKARDWRGDARYAAKVAAMVLETIVEKDLGRLGNLALVSSDNAFLNEPGMEGGHFDQRTMTARFFCGNGSVFVTKPVYNAFAMLGMLGQDKLGVDVVGGEEKVLAVASTTSSRSFSVLMVNTDDEEKVDVSIKVHGLPKSVAESSSYQPKFFYYTLSDEDTDPRSVWAGSGSPSCPDKNLTSVLRSSATLKRTAPLLLDRSNFKTRLPASGLKMLQICYPDNDYAPNQPTNLQFNNEEGGKGVIATWDYRWRAECLWRFTIERASLPQGVYNVLTISNSPVNFAYIDFEEEDDNGWWYRVRATDVWGREGTPCAPTYF